MDRGETCCDGEIRVDRAYSSLHLEWKEVGEERAFMGKSWFITAGNRGERRSARTAPSFLMEDVRMRSCLLRIELIIARSFSRF